MKILLTCIFLTHTWISTTDNLVLGNCDLKFEVINAGFTVEGSLQATVIEGHFDPEKLDESHVLIVANPATINTGISIRDKHLQRTDYFNTNAFPDIKLVSQSFEKKSGNKFLGKFKLSIKGITKDFEVSFAMRSSGGKKKYEGSFTINRLDFELGKPSLTLSDEVLIKFSIN